MMDEEGSGGALERAILVDASENHLFVGSAGVSCPVLLMVSGGGDSIALLHLMSALRGPLGLGAMRVLHVNHLLRGVDADGDQGFVEQVSRELGIECVSRQVDIGKMVRETGGNLEAIAREVRYRLADEELDGLCRREGVDPSNGRIVVAHNADDRAETFYMRSIVGGGLGSLTSLRPLTGRVARPVLHVTRQELRDYLQVRAVGEGRCGADDDPVAAGLWREDATNGDIEHFRAYVRHEVIPRLEVFNPRLVQTLGRSLDHLTDEDRLLDGLARELAEGLVETDSDDGMSIDMEGLAQVDISLRRRIVRLAVLSILPAQTRLDGFHIDALVDEGMHVGFMTVLPTGLIARNEYGKLTFHREKVASSKPCFAGAWLEVPGSLRLEDGRTIEARFVSGDADFSDTPYRRACVDLGARRRLWVHHPVPGERMCPLGMGGRSKKVSDILVDAKVPAYRRDGILMVRTDREEDSQAVWLVGLCVDDRCRVDASGPSGGGLVLLSVTESASAGEPCAG